MPGSDLGTGDTAMNKVPMVSALRKLAFFKGAGVDRVNKAVIISRRQKAENVAKGKRWEDPPSPERYLSCGLKAKNESAMQRVEML